MRLPLRFVALAAVVGPIAALGLGPGSASADDKLRLSVDGSHWTRTIDQPLFDPAVHWAAGDVRTAHFFVRTSAAEAGDLAIDVSSADAGAPVLGGSLRIAARTGSARWTVIAADGRTLVGVGDVDHAGSVPVTVRVRMESDAPAATTVRATDLDFHVALIAAGVSDDGPTSSGVQDSGTADAGMLPATGSDVPPWLPPLGLVLLGAGAFAAARRHDPLLEI